MGAGEVNLFDILGALHDDGLPIGLTDEPIDLGMALLPIDHDLTTHGIQLGELATNLLLQGEHDGASSIDELDVTLTSELIDGGCFPVGTEEHALPLRAS